MTVLTMFWNWSLISFGRINDLGCLPPMTGELIENVSRKLRVKQITYLAESGLLPQEISRGPKDDYLKTPLHRAIPVESYHLDLAF